MNVFKKATIAAAVAATALVSASPAMAQNYRRGGDDTAAIAIGAGIVGLAIGAIVASSNNNRDFDYRRNGWQYRDGYYWDRSGNRYDRQGRRFQDNGYYARRGYGNNGYNGYGNYRGGFGY
jgi:hypothetical protein